MLAGRKMHSPLQGVTSRPKRYRKYCPIDDCTSTALKTSTAFAAVPLHHELTVKNKMI